MSKKRDHAEEQAVSAGGGTSASPRTPVNPAENGARPAVDQNPVSPARDDAPTGEAAPAPASLDGAEGDVGQARALAAEVLDLRDKLLRKQADFENYRKRMIRERDEAARYANAALLTDVISTIDDFERAIRSAEESRDFPSFLQGVSMIEKQLLETLESRWGLKRFSALGESFDPNRHEAVLRVEGPSDSKPTVVEDYQKGYYLHERVLRPARVKVQVPAAQESPKESSPAPGGADGAPGRTGEAR